MRSFLCAYVFVVIFNYVHSSFPADAINIEGINKTVYLANETYKFVLVPKYQVPLQLYRHVIYTASTGTITSGIKRALFQVKKRGVLLSPEDFEALSSYMELPSFVKVDVQKRSTPPNSDGLRTISIGKDTTLIFTDPSLPTQKRQAPFPVGLKMCLHVPFFTSCDNEGDITDVKTTLQAALDSCITELDSYKDTNNARATEMANVLDRQRKLIQNIAQQAGLGLSVLDAVASAAKANAAQQGHGDYIAHAQINYLKRVTNSLLRYANALSSADPRAVVVQPSLAQLFSGYLTILGAFNKTTSLNLTGVTPIIDSRVFDYIQYPLPVGSVTNVEEVKANFLSNSQQLANLAGLKVVTTLTCDSNEVCATTPYTCSEDDYFQGSIAMKKKSGDPNFLGARGDHWLLGPFHVGHTLMYPIRFLNLSSNSEGTCKTIGYGRLTSTFIGGTLTTNPGVDTVIDDQSVATSLYCVEFLGFSSLASFNTTPNMINGIPSDQKKPLSDCSNYLLTTAQDGNSTYFLYAITEGILVPFYSNCMPTTFNAETGASVSFLANYPNGGAAFPNNNLSPNRTVFSVYKPPRLHWVSSKCYMNIEPEWIGLEYYFPRQNSVIPNIPRGFTLNEFTINPDGELASSLEFLYTREWAWVYQVKLVSNNTVTVDEIGALNNEHVLFHLSGPTVVDESDSFFGESNNGRDCIRKSPEYEFDLTNCFFQNNEKSFSVSDYLLGKISTTGIARYTNKFEFTLNSYPTTFGGDPVPGYQFTLKPRATSDFTITVNNYNGQICPDIFLPPSSLDGCKGTLFYAGSQDVTYLRPGVQNHIALTFDQNNQTEVSMTFSDSQYSFYVNNFLCFSIKCQIGQTSNSVIYNEPARSLISASDLALNRNVFVEVTRTTDSTLDTLDEIKKHVAQAQANLSNIISALGNLDFNTTKIVPYEDFSALRDQVRGLIQDISPAGSRACASGFLGSLGCWFEEALSTLIVIAVVIAVGVGCYCIFVKCGLCSKICGKDREF